MIKAYVVTDGEYSSYEIVKVFLNKEKAEKFAELYSKGDVFSLVSVEEYEIYDDCFEITLEEPATYYAQYINLENGKLGWYGETKILSTAKSFYELKYGGIKAYSKESLEHAKKIAIEQYQIHTQRAFEEQMSIDEYFDNYIKNYKGAIQWMK